MDPDSPKRDHDIKIGVVGPCSAGKSTLISALQRRGIPARHIAQEHSHVPDMWQRLVDPDILIYLEVSYTVSMQRRPLDMSPGEFAEQVHRLRHARQNADTLIDTDSLSVPEVLDRVLTYLSTKLKL